MYPSSGKSANIHILSHTSRVVKRDLMNLRKKQAAKEKKEEMLTDNMPKTRDGCGPFGDDENSRTNKCSFCGDSDPEDSVCADGYTICAACAEQMDIRDVMDLFGFETVSELIGALSS